MRVFPSPVSAVLARLQRYSEARRLSARRLPTCCRRALLPLALTTLLGLGAPALAISSVQLTAAIDQGAAYRNGDALTLSSPPRVIRGRTMLPLRETAAVLGQTVGGDSVQLQLGRLTLDLRQGAAYLNGAPQPAGSTETVGGVLYVQARLLADALGANLVFSEDGRSLTLTALPAGGNPLAPQARFSTDRSSYAPGERVVYTEYAYDPDGAEIVSRKWSGRQDAYFSPGSYTVSLTVTNSRGLSSTPYSRTITVAGPPLDTPLSYALKYAEPGETFSDPNVLTYPAINAVPVPTPSYPLLFSDSPETPAQSGVLYQDSLSGRARLLAYHTNGLGKPARLYVVARNLESRPVEVRTERLGETAPTRTESLLGQVTLLQYFASTEDDRVVIGPGESLALYASPTLGPGSGVNMMQDLSTSGSVELTFMLLEDGLPPTPQVVQQLPYLPNDGRHQRGTFPDAVRTLRVNLGQLPARLVIGDGQVDPAIVGVDKLSNQPQRLVGNYGVLYDIEVRGAAGTAVALSPRGGLYRGAMQITDGPLQQAIKLPRSGSATSPNQPTLLWRASSPTMHIDFVPASGSNLPISLVFYRSGRSSSENAAIKRYMP